MLEAGTIVRSIAGHDKNLYYIVVRCCEDRVFIADGRERKLAEPKAKNLKHLMVTNQKIALTEISSDKALSRKLEPMNQSLKRRQHRGRE